MAKKRLTVQYLRKIGFQSSVATGMLIASVLGWNEWNKLGPNIFNNKTLFPYSVTTHKVVDGDTFELVNGLGVRLLAINTPDRGEVGYDLATEKLKSLIDKKKIFLEYDRTTTDKEGRILVWIWLNCESRPKFLPYKYMYLSGNKSREGLKENPKGCEKGKLVQEELIKSGHAKVEVYKDRGELKYEKRMFSLTL